MIKSAINALEREDKPPHPTPISATEGSTLRGYDLPSVLRALLSTL